MFWDYSKCCWIKQSAPGLNRGLSSNFWWLSCANNVKFTEECVMCTRKHLLVKKNVYQWTKHWFVTMSLSWNENSLNGNKLTLWLKKKVVGAAVSKEGHTDCLLGHEETSYCWFHLKGAGVNSASYCQLLKQNSPHLLNVPFLALCVCVCVCVCVYMYIYIHTHTYIRVSWVWS